MNRIILFVGTAVLSWLLAMTSAQACETGTWPIDSAKYKGKPEEALTKLEKRHKIKIRRSAAQYRCGRDTNYDILDEKGDLLVVVPIPETDGQPHPGLLTARVNHVMRTPKADLRRLIVAHETFMRDVADIHEDYGIRFYHPNALPLNDRMPGGQRYRLYATSEECSEVPASEGREAHKRYSSASMITDEFFVDVAEYTPARTLYRPEEVYREGQLRAYLIRNPNVLRKMAERSDGNRQHCTGNWSERTQEQWAAHASRMAALAGPAPAPERPAPGESPGDQ